MREQRRVVEFTEPSMTRQSFKDQCDINVIMRRFSKRQTSDFLRQFNGYVGGQFGDFSNVLDYRSALDQVRRADDVFMALPAVVRKEFDNDAAAFLDFCHDPRNSDRLVEMGLAEPKPQPVVKVSSEEKKV